MLQLADRQRIQQVIFAVSAVVIAPSSGEVGLGIHDGLKCVLMLHLALASQHIQADPLEAGGRSREIGIHQIFVQSDRFENLSSAIALERRDAHFRKGLQ